MTLKICDCLKLTLLVTAELTAWVHICMPVCMRMCLCVCVFVCRVEGGGKTEITLIERRA